mmetsp:Transcript_66612/g.130629  ORF Transcript_66612/g.130629 Transcript_66612/m.130629 type:complete len:383 (-) Transcript_66612:1204-2352(-)
MQVLAVFAPATATAALAVVVVVVGVVVGLVDQKVEQGSVHVPRHRPRRPGHEHGPSLRAQTPLHRRPVLSQPVGHVAPRGGRGRGWGQRGWRKFSSWWRWWWRCSSCSSYPSASCCRFGGSGGGGCLFVPRKCRHQAKTASPLAARNDVFFYTPNSRQLIILIAHRHRSQFFPKQKIFSLAAAPEKQQILREVWHVFVVAVLIIIIIIIIHLLLLLNNATISPLPPPPLPHRPRIIISSGPSFQAKLPPDAPPLFNSREGDGSHRGDARARPHQHQRLAHVAEKLRPRRKRPRPNPHGNQTSSWSGVGGGSQGGVSQVCGAAAGDPRGAHARFFTPVAGAVLHHRHAQLEGVSTRTGSSTNTACLHHPSRRCHRRRHCRRHR